MPPSGLLILAVLSLTAGRGLAEEPRWLLDYEEAHKQAGRTGKPLFVVFRCPH